MSVRHTPIEKNTNVLYVIKEILKGNNRVKYIEETTHLKQQTISGTIMFLVENGVLLRNKWELYILKEIYKPILEKVELEVKKKYEIEIKKINEIKELLEEYKPNKKIIENTIKNRKNELEKQENKIKKEIENLKKYGD